MGTEDKRQRKNELLVAVATVIISILSSTASAGFMIGRYDERLTGLAKQAAQDRLDLGARLQELGVKIEQLNASTGNLTAGVTGLRVETENLKSTLEHERQDRIADRAAKH